MRFRDHSDAGRQLAEVLVGKVDDPAVVLALPRGGVPVAAEDKRSLGLPLDVIVVRKLRVQRRTPSRRWGRSGSSASGCWTVT